MISFKKAILSLAAVLFFKSNGNTQSVLKSEKINIEIVDNRILDLLDVNTQVDILTEGLGWTEGPLWVDKENMLLFSEIPSNTVYKWSAAKGIEVYLRPSGYSAQVESESKEPGSNGLLLDNKGNLVLCQHGDRRLAKMNAALQMPKSDFINIVDRYRDLRFNSPNDAVYNASGDLYFTDPPYGLPKQDDKDPAKELKFNGVFVLKKNNELILLSEIFTRPNGIAIMPSTNKILVSNSDPQDAAWYLLDPNKPKQKPVLFYDATQEKKGPGLPDGLKISKNGIVYASGPAGVWVFDTNAKLLGKIIFDTPVSNVALSADERFMFLTNTGRVVRIALK